LSVYLRDNHGIQPQGYGVLLTFSALTVIAFQFWMMRVIKMQPQFLMMALGTLFYLVGFGMFGIVSSYGLFALAIVIITVGEMIVMPTSQTLAAGFARMEMRGRYMAVFGLSVSLPNALGPLAAGIVLDNYRPNLLWVLSAAVCAMSVIGFYVLHLKLGSQPRFTAAAPRTERPALAMEAEHG